MPLALLLSVTVAIFETFGRTIRAFLARFRRGHVVVCDSGERAYNLVENLARDGKTKVVVIEMNEKSDDEAYHRLNVPVIQAGGPVTFGTLRAASLHRASALVAMCDDDMLNVEAVLKAKALVQKSRSHTLPPLKARAAVGDPDLRQAASLLLVERSPTYEFGMMSLQRNMVRGLLADHPLDLDDAVVAGARTHVVIVGFGETGKALALQIGRMAHFADGRKPLLTIVDQDATAAVESFARQHVSFRNACDLHAVSADMRQEQPEGLEAIFSDIRPTRVVICLGNEGLGLAAGAKVQRTATRFNLGDLPIFVRLSGAPSVAGAIARASGATLAYIRPFGQPEKVSTPEIVLKESLDLMARAVHQTYLEMIGPPARDAPVKPSAEPWERLAEDYRDASRHQSDHLEAKLRAVNFEAVKGDQESKFDLSPEEIERLAQMEHARWCAERYIAGWRHGAVRNDATREHPSLEPWDDLSAAEKQKDRDMVHGIPRILKNAGYYARRVGSEPAQKTRLTQLLRRK
nr:NAD-binding protein [Variibacter gotjawalensis]